MQRTTLLTCALATAFLLPLHAQNPSMARVVVGGKDTCGSEGGNPPVLNNGTLARGELRFTFDHVAKTLVLAVHNTSPVTTGVPNPLITSIWFGVPRGAVTGLELLDQKGAGGAQPKFTLSFDAELGDGSDPNHAGGLGAFHAQLHNGGGISGGIANPAADTIGGPPGAAVIGPAEFTFRVSGPSLGGLTASSFAESVALVGGTCPGVTAALKFQAGGPDAEGSARIASGGGCHPSAFHVGEPCIGKQVTFAGGAAPGCKGCLVFSLDGRPFRYGSLLIPISPPYLELMAGPIDYINRITITIPDDPKLIGLEVFYTLAVIANGVEFSPRYSFVICE